MNNNPSELSLKVHDPELIKKVIKYKERTGTKYTNLMELALGNFFNDKRNQLITLTKDELVDIILKGEKA